MMRNQSPTNEDKKSGETSKEIIPKGVDYISHVPRDILHHILLFLPFEYSMILGMVSKQWQDLLRETSTLNLDENKIVSKMMRQICGVLHDEKPPSNELDKCKQKFAFVNSVILYHSGCHIKFACLCLQYEPRTIYASNVNNWVHFFMTRDIEAAKLDFSSTTPHKYCDGELEALAERRTRTAKTFELPHQPFEPKFTSFHLNFCKLKASRFGSLMNLKVLYLKDVDILDLSIGQLVSKCQVLKTLFLERCFVTEKFFVCKQDLKIKNLKLKNCFTERRRMYMIDVTVSQLTNLVIIGRYLMSSIIRNAINLVDCSIYINVHFSDMEQGNFLAMLMINLRNCETLSLSSWCIQVLPTLDVGLKQQLHGSFNNLTSLKLTVGYVKQELPGIVLLLLNCRCLENLVLEIDQKAKNIHFLNFDTLELYQPEAFQFEEANYLENRDIFCLQKSLKVLTIYGFMGRNEKKHLLEFLLRKALVLENLEIYHDLPDESETQESTPSDLELQQLRMLQALQDLPRASSVVEVYVEKVAVLDDYMF